MNPAVFDLPRGAVIVFNDLFTPPVPVVHLRQDLLAIRRLDGMMIDVGWYPACDSSGQYVVSTYRDSWELRQIELESRDFRTVVETVEGLAVIDGPPALARPPARSQAKE